MSMLLEEDIRTRGRAEFDVRDETMDADSDDMDSDSDDSDSDQFDLVAHLGKGNGADTQL